MGAEERDNGSEARRSRIKHRTSQLSLASRVLYRIEHYTVLPVISLIVIGAVISLVVVIACLGFKSDAVAAFELSVSTVTLLLVFAIQHTQGREQAATQRKLDELIRAMPGANESFMMLEEASRHDLLEVEHEQRGVRSQTPDGTT